MVEVVVMAVAMVVVVMVVMVVVEVVVMVVVAADLVREGKAALHSQVANHHTFWRGPAVNMNSSSCF